MSTVRVASVEAARHGRVHAPRFREQLVAALSAAPTLHECSEEAEFGRGQLDLFVIQGDDVRTDIEPELSRAQDLSSAGDGLELALCTAKDRVHPKHKLPRAEGLCEVVVGTQFQSLDSVDLLPLGGEDEHGYRTGRGVRADGLQDIVAGDAGQHPVKDQQVGQLPLQGVQSGRAVQGRLNPVSLPRELVRNQSGDLPLVLDDQHAGRQFPPLRFERGRHGRADGAGCSVRVWSHDPPPGDGSPTSARSLSVTSSGSSS